jgi:hypothetical protein
MNGQRVFDKAPHELKPGEYGRWGADKDRWYASTPNGEVANLSAHDVHEHSDGSITVQPSILVSTSRHGQRVELWHGWLTRGVWKSC